MQLTSIFETLFTLTILFSSSLCQASVCNTVANTLSCTVSNDSVHIDISSYNVNTYNSISIIYAGEVTLNLTSLSVQPISIVPANENYCGTLQISSLKTNTARIEIKVCLSSNSTPRPLFASNSIIMASQATISVYVTENGVDASNFKVFNTPGSPMMNFSNYEIIFNRTGISSQTLYLSNIILPTTNIKSITISGNNHTLALNDSSTLLFNTVNQLSLKYLRLYDRILDCFTDLTLYSIEGCQYNRTSKFLQSKTGLNVLSLVMKNNNPTDSILPNNNNAFNNLNLLNTLTIIEPKLNSSCLAAFKSKRDLRNVLLDLKAYVKSDLTDWAQTRPLVKILTMQSISSLDIFPSKFFNGFDAIDQIKLKGVFELRKKDICTFYSVNIQIIAVLPIVEIDNGKQSETNDACADIYIKAINQRTTENVACPPKNTCNDCREWAKTADQCDLTSYENKCDGTTNSVGDGNPFMYNSSFLYYFFKNNTCAYRPTLLGNADSLNIGAIIGALCGLLIAIIILAITIFFIYRSRQKKSIKNTASMREAKYKPSSSDSTHVSIATSKSSKSSRYALENSFFPPIQPNDEIAPPLYAAPSESVGSTSNYRMPPAPSAPRASVSTHATHIYETVDT